MQDAIESFRCLPAKCREAVHADDKEDVGTLELHHVARLHFHKVRVLISLHDEIHLHFVTADLLDEISKVRQRGDDHRPAADRFVG